MKFSLSKLKTQAAAILAIASMGVQLIAPAASSLGSVSAATNTNQTVTTNTVGSNKLVSPALASTRTEDKLTFHMTGVTTKGYMRVDRHDGKDPEYMISEQFADQYNRIAYCMDSELPTPNGGSTPNTAEGNDQFLRMFLNGYPTKTPAQLGTANEEEAWYATQVVSWTLAGDWKWSDIVWSTPEQTQESVDRVHHAAQLIYDAAINGKDTQNTTFDLQKVSQQDKNGFHEFTYKATSNRNGVAQIKLNNTVAGLTIVDQNGQTVSNNNVNLNQNFTIKVPVTAAAGNINFDVNGTIKTYKSLVYGDKATGFQRAITAFTATETPVVKNASLSWARGQGQVKVTKIDSDTKANLKGAEFTLTDQNGVKQVKTTDANGLADFTVQQGNTYDLKETKNPAGYNGSFEQKGITVANDGQVFSYTAGNKLNKGSISVKKVDESNKPLAGAEFTLTDNDGKKVVETTDKSGLATFSIVANKTYSLKETKNPTGYNGSFEKKDITLANNGQVFSYTVGNKLNKGTVSVHKTDQDGKALAGAEFTLTDNAGVKTKKVTDKNGLVTFAIDANKTYTLDETKAPAGYHGSFHQAGITIANDGQTFNYTVKNTLNKGLVKIHKVDQDGKALANAEFTLTDKNGVKTKATTDKTGYASFEIKANNVYSLDESKLPAGYHGKFHKDGITIANDGQTFEYTVPNTLNRGTVKVHKVDQNKKPLKGAEFTLTDKNGVKTKSVTDKNGYAQFTIAANNVYSLDETKVPAGYHGSFHKDGITVANDGQTFDYSVSNILNRGTVKIHKVDQDGNSLKGAEFTLTDNDGKKVTATTDDNGYAAFNLEANKTYSLDETKNPTGYNGSFHKDDITVAKDQQVFEYTAKNNLNKAKINVAKVDQDGKALKGAEFTLTDNDGKTVVATTDDKGLASFDIVANKTYDLKETKNPTGYNGSFEQKDITVAEDGQTFNYKATNNLNKGEVQIAKVDEKGNPVKGAEFTLTDNDGKKVVTTTDEKGFAKFAVVANKTYALDETKVPAGYSGSYHKDGISIKDDGDIVKIKAVNMKDKIQTLIKTGSKKPMTMISIIAGLALLIVALVLFVKDRKKNMNA